MIQFRKLPEDVNDLKLPIFEIQEALTAACLRSSRLLLRAPTGSGKSTQVPQMLLDAGLLGSEGQVVILQPRRLAARMLAARVASERSSRLGEEVGYQIRFDHVSGPNTRILFVTEGILLRWLLRDPDLRGVSAILFDEFHERHLYGDISLARALDLQSELRPDLKIVVMSATLDCARLTQYLHPCEVLESDGRTFPVEIDYLSREPGDEPVWELAADAIRREFPKSSGNALVFMSGAFEIQRTIRAIEAKLGGSVPVLPLHGELPPEQQDQAVGGGGGRRIIVSTNVAETSLTIQNVTLVVDSGLARIARFDPHRGINTLYIEKISRASADQRAGRAGRTIAGRCIRLWTARDHERRAMVEIPEIRRMDLAETVLHLNASGVNDPGTFRWLEAPEQAALVRAQQLLVDLGAVDESGITAIGSRMLQFPVHPRVARMFLAAEKYACVKSAALIAAITQSRNVLLRVDKKTEALRSDILGDATSDFQVVMRAWTWADRQSYRMDACKKLGIHADGARQLGRLFRQFLDIAKAEGLTIDSPPPEDSAVAKCVLAAFADQVARRRSPGTLLCDIVHGRRGVLSRQSVAQSSTFLVASEINDIEGRDREAQVQLTMATEIEESWLRELFPDDFTTHSEVCFDPSQNRVVIRTERIFRDLVLDARDRDAEPSPEASTCLARQVVEGNLVLKQWDAAVEQWILRVNRLAAWMPEIGIAPITPSDRELIIAEVCRDAVCYRDIKEKPVLREVKSWLSAAQHQLVEKWVPERVSLPAGKLAKVTYSADAEPFLAAKIQDLYGLKQAPSLCGGRVPLTVQILAPNMRPVQVTRDLKSFWNDAYPKLSQELKRRYPKHEWRYPPI